MTLVASPGPSAYKWADLMPASSSAGAHTKELSDVPLQIDPGVATHSHHVPGAALGCTEDVGKRIQDSGMNALAGLSRRREVHCGEGRDAGGDDGRNGRGGGWSSHSWRGSSDGGGTVSWRRSGDSQGAATSGSSRCSGGRRW